jgi:hypothetical protein
MAIDAQRISQEALNLVDDVEKAFGADAVLRNVALVASVDLYAHLMPGSEAEAADLLGAYLARAAEPTSPETSPRPLETAA